MPNAPKKRSIVFPTKREGSVTMNIAHLRGLPLEWAFHAVRRGRLIDTVTSLAITPEDIKSVMADWPGLMLRQTPAGTEAYHQQNPAALVHSSRAEWAIAKAYLLLMGSGPTIEIPGFLVELEDEQPSL